MVWIDFAARPKKVFNVEYRSEISRRSQNTYKYFVVFYISRQRARASDSIKSSATSLCRIIQIQIIRIFVLAVNWKLPEKTFINAYQLTRYGYLFTAPLHLIKNLILLAAVWQKTINIVNEAYLYCEII